MSTIMIKVIGYGNGGNLTSGGNFLHKVISEKKVEILGTTKSVKQTYYIFLKVKVAMNTEGPINLDDFRIELNKGVIRGDKFVSVEAIADPKNNLPALTEEEDVFELKYLYLK